MPTRSLSRRVSRISGAIEPSIDPSFRAFARAVIRLGVVSAHHKLCSIMGQQRMREPAAADLPAPRAPQWAHSSRPWG